jgi:hypothetical protein
MDETRMEGVKRAVEAFQRFGEAARAAIATLPPAEQEKVFAHDDVRRLERELAEARRKARW